MRLAALAGRVRPRHHLLLLGAAFAVYLGVLHPWLVGWGATAAERRMALPGDDLVPDPAWQTTRAITIRAPAAEVWAWLIQHGQDRAGFSSYTWLENLVGADIHNADSIHPAWQRRAAGDGIPMGRADVAARLGLGEASASRVAAVEPGRALVLEGSGAFVLQPVDDRTTRLLERHRNGSASASPGSRALGTVFPTLVWDPMHFVMRRQMLRGIGARAEGHPQPPLALAVVARAGWTAAGLGVAGVFLARRRRWHWLLLPLAATVPALALGHDADAALAGFLAVGITAGGALAWGRRWWPPFLTLASAVMLTLLLAPDAYVAFRLAFAAVALAVVAGAGVGRWREGAMGRTRRWARGVA
jgi:hypothetical protein